MDVYIGIKQAFMDYRNRGKYWHAYIEINVWLSWIVSTIQHLLEPIRYININSKDEAQLRGDMNL